MTMNSWQNLSWQKQLAHAFVSPEALLDFLQIDGKQLKISHQKAHQTFKTRVPHSFAARMKPGDLEDPLLKQVLPTEAEMIFQPGFTADPLAETEANKVPGILHKYHGRALLMLGSTCAVNCRYCFRRHFAYEDNTLHSQNLEYALNYLKNDPSIQEVILSGGDPLVVKDEYLAAVVAKLAAIVHVKRLRIHSRLPIVLPARITDSLVKVLTSTRLQTVMVVHCNHGNELNAEVKQAIDLLHQAHIPVLNQAVLLKTINDSLDVQVALSERLFELKILPYYLHLLDPVAGAAHFQISPEAALALYRKMQARLPGYLLPRLSQEVPGFTSKQLLV